MGATALAGPAYADQVSLRSTDGTINLQGQLISFDDEHYRIQTALGDLRVSADTVRCEGSGCPVFDEISADVAIAGSDTITTGLMPLLLAGFATNLDADASSEKTQEQGEFATTLVGQSGFGDEIGTYLVRSGPAESAFSNLLDQSIQLATSTRRILPDEARALKAAGAGNMIDPSQEHIIAIDSLVVIVNPQNPIQEIGMADLAKIYSGEVTNWSQLGGPDLAIQTVTQEDTGANAVFKTGVLGSENTDLASAHQAEDNVAAAAFVGENPGAIAYVGYAFKRGQKPLALVSECGIGTTPDAFSVKTEEYALFRRLYMYNRADQADALSADFLGFATSDAASQVILQSGFIDLAIEKAPDGADDLRIARLQAIESDSFETQLSADLIAMLDANERLSSTFRFRTGSSKLDPRGELDLERLATYLGDMPDGTIVTFVGFTDDVGAFEPNLALSQNRADQVRDALTAIAGDSLEGITFAATGFGEIAPGACNTSDTGRSINRRVETWVQLP
ncbi:MAG: phosphate ABC transporter substrate-binding/OmpA family protein [Pseudomonadota bacterium]